MRDTATMQQTLGQVGQAISELASAENENSQNLAQIQAVVQELIGTVDRLEKGQSTVGGPTQPVSIFDQPASAEAPIRTEAPRNPVNPRTQGMEDPFNP